MKTFFETVLAIFGAAIIAFALFMLWVLFKIMTSDANPFI